MRHREVEWPVQGHTVKKSRSWHLYLDLCDCGGAQWPEVT